MEIVVAARRSPPPATLRDTVDARTIERFSATTVGETLERLPSASAGQDSRGERTLSLRGFSQRQIAVYVDGIPLAVPYDGQLDLSKLPVDLVARLTIVQAADTSLVGPNALGGAIGVVLREPRERPSLTVSTESSPRRSTRASLSATGRIGAWGALGGVAGQGVRSTPLSSDFVRAPNEDGGERNNTDRRVGSGIGKVSVDLDDAHRLSVLVSRFGGAYGVPPATRAFQVRFWRWTDWTATTLGVAHAYRGGRVTTDEVVYVTTFENLLDAYDDQRYASQALPKAFHSLYDDVSVGVTSRARAPLTTPLGEARLESWVGARHDRHASRANRGEPLVTVATTLLTAAARAELDLLRDRLLVSGAVQADGELPSDPPAGLGPAPTSAWAPGPAASIVYRPDAAGRFVVSASAAVRHRFPTLRERFSTVFGAREPNLGLAAEQSRNASLDTSWSPRRGLVAAVGVFASDVRDEIATVTVRPGVDRLDNVGRLRIVGSEVRLSFVASRFVELSVGGVWSDVERLEGTTPVVYRPPKRGLALLALSPWSFLTLTGIARYVDEQTYQNPDTGVYGTLAAYGLVDARADVTVAPGIRAYGRVQNVFDANVEARWSFPEPGRQAFVGLSATLGDR